VRNRFGSSTNSPKNASGSQSSSTKHGATVAWPV
jgi:hypothetical protein